MKIRYHYTAHGKARFLSVPIGESSIYSLRETILYFYKKGFVYVFSGETFYIPWNIACWIQDRYTDLWMEARQRPEVWWKARGELSGVEVYTYCKPYHVYVRFKG